VRLLPAEEEVEDDEEEDDTADADAETHCRSPLKFGAQA
jgi:hypothetical protein